MCPDTTTQQRSHSLRGAHCRNRRSWPIKRESHTGRCVPPSTLPKQHGSTYLLYRRIKGLLTECESFDSLVRFSTRHHGQHCNSGTRSRPDPARWPRRARFPTPTADHQPQQQPRRGHQGAPASKRPKSQTPGRPRQRAGGRGGTATHIRAIRKERRYGSRRINGAGTKLPLLEE